MNGFTTFGNDLFSLDEVQPLPQLATNLPLEDPQSWPCLAENNNSTQRLVAPAKNRDPFLYASYVLWDAFRRTPDPSSADLEELAAEAELDRFQVSLWFEGEKECRTRSTPNHPPTPDRTRFYTLPSSNPNIESRQHPDPFLHATEVLRYAFSREPEPSQQEMGDTAAEAGLHQYQVIYWFRRARNACKETTARGPITPEVTRSTALSTLTLEAEPNQNRISISGGISIQPTTESSAQGNNRKRKSRTRKKNSPKRRRQTEGTNNPQDSSNSGASGEGQYPCPSCDEISYSRENWLSHQEESHFPKKRFVCGIQHPRLSSGHPFTRKDNFRTHLRDHHKITEAQALKRVISNGTINFTSLYHEVCGFCSQKQDSRDASLDHILADIEKGYQISDWNHQCSSRDHDIEEQVRLELDRRVFEPGNASFHDDDNDHGGSGGLNLDGGDDPGDGGNSSGPHDIQDNGEGNSYGDGGGGSSYQAIGYVRMARDVAECQPKALRLASSPNPGERTSSLIIGKHSFKMLRTLGRGGSAEVFEVSHNSSKQTFALKVIPRKRLGVSDLPEQRAFNNEVQIMRNLRHPHIVEFLGSRIQPDCFSLLMSPVADMNLAEYLTTTREASLKRLAPADHSSLFRLCSSIGEALIPLHSIGFCHGDIKPSNILLFNNKKEASGFNAKLSDFGCATLSSHHGGQCKFTPKYASPETILHGSKSLAADIWSLGCVFALVVTYMRYQSLSEFERLCFTDGDKSFHRNVGRVDQWVKMMDKEQERTACPDKAHMVPFDIISKMLHENPENRPTAREVWLRFPKCTCCSECRATRYQSPSGQNDNGGDLQSNQDWRPRVKTSQIVDDSVEYCVPVCATRLKGGDAAFSSTDATLPLMCSSSRLDAILTNLDNPKGSTTVGGPKGWSLLYEPPYEAVLEYVLFFLDVSLILIAFSFVVVQSRFHDWRRRERKVHWLQDMVPRMPQARVFTYWYDSSVWSDSSGGGITTAARDPLERLAYVREDCHERPIVFVADRLGDTIVKKVI